MRALSCDARGFSLIELLIAMTIGLMTITSVVLVAETLTGGEINAELISRAHLSLEIAQADAHTDFQSVNSRVLTAGAYTDSTFVDQLSDFVTKRVRSQSRYTAGHINIATEITTLITNQDNVLAPDTCSSVVSGDWTNPTIVNYPLMRLIATTTGPYTISDIDAFKGYLYVSSDRRAYRTDPALYVFDVSGAPTLRGSLRAVFAATQGLAAVRVADDSTSGHRHAFAVSKTTAQFQSIDVSDPVNPIIAASRSFTGGEGNTITVYNGYAYVGLAALLGTPEFRVVDVRTPGNPIVVGVWPASGGIGSGVNAIRVRRGYAYVAHGITGSYAEQISVLNVHTPSSPYHVSGYVAPLASTFPNSGNGKSIALVGTTLFVGRTASNKVGVPQFVMVDASRPFALGASALGSTVLVPDVSIQRIIIRDTLAFILTNTKLLIYRIDNPANPTLYASVALPATGGSTAPSMDCEGNTLYVGSNDASNIGTLSLITTL